MDKPVSTLDFPASCLKTTCYGINQHRLATEGIAAFIQSDARQTMGKTYKNPPVMRV